MAKMYSFIVCVSLALISCEVKFSTEKVSKEGNQIDSLKEEHYSNGKLASKERYVNGVPEGEQIYWFSNGNKKQQINFKNGLKDGIFYVWWENGKLKEKSNWKADKEEGEIIHYYTNGQMEEKSVRKQGQLEGRAESYYQNGQLKTLAFFKMNKKDSIWITYDSLGKEVKRMDHRK